MGQDVTSLKLSIDSREVKTGAKDLDNLSLSSKKAESAASNLTNKVLALGAAYASFSSITKAVDIFKEMENAQIGVAKTTGLSAVELRKLTTELDTMATTMSGFEIKGLYDIAEAAGQLGIKGTENIKEFTRVIAMVGLTTDLTAGDAATSFAKLSNSLNEPIDKIERLASVANELSNNTTATVDDLLRFSQRLSGGAKTAGLMTDEIFGLSATMTDLAINFETGGTNVNKVMLDLIASSDKFAEAMGVNFDSFAQTVQNEPVKALQQLLGYMEGLSKTDAANFLESLGYSGTEVKDVMLKLSSNTELLSKNLKISHDEYVSGTSISKEYEQASIGLEAQMTKVSAALKLLASDAGENLKQPMIEAADAIIGMSTALREMDIAEYLPAIKGVAATVAILYIAVKSAAVAEAALTSFRAASIVTTTAYNAALMRTVTTTTTLTASQTAAAIATRAMGTAMKAVPFIAVASAVTYLATSFFEATRDSDELNKSIDQTADSLAKLTKNQFEYRKTVLYDAYQDLAQQVRLAETEAREQGIFQSDKAYAKELADLDSLKNKLKEAREAYYQIRDFKAPASTTTNTTAKTKAQTREQPSLFVNEEDKDKAKKALEDRLRLEENYQEDLAAVIQSGLEGRLEGLDREALQTFNYYDNLIAKYSEVAGAEATLRALQSQAMDEIAAKIQEHNDLIDNTAAIDALDEINDRYQTILDSQIAIAENGMNIDFNFEGTAADLDDIAKALQKMHVGSLKSTKADIDLQHKYAKDFLAAGDDIVKQKEAEANFDEDQAKLNEERKTAEIAGYASLAGAVSGAFAEGSAAAEAFQVVQAGLALTNAVGAVIGAWNSAPFPANIPAVAATTASVAALLSNINQSLSGGGGGASAQAGADYAGMREKVSDSSDLVIDRLDRQIELLESLNLQGSASVANIELAQAEFNKSTDLLKITAREKAYGYEWGQTVAENVLSGKTAYTNMTKDEAQAILDRSIYDYLAELDIENITYFYGDKEAMIQGFNEVVGEAQEAINNYAVSMVDTVSEMEDAGQRFEELFDAISGTNKYADIELQKAQEDVTDILMRQGGSTSITEYLTNQIDAINAVSDAFGLDIKKLLLSTKPEDLQAQADAVEALSIASKGAFSGGIEEALNFLDSIELVGEALATSNENIKSYNDSFKTEQQLAEDLAKTMGVTLAKTVEDLDKLFLKLSTDWDGLTDSELELLEANKALLDVTSDASKQLLDLYTGQYSPLTMLQKTEYANSAAYSSFTSGSASAIDDAYRALNVAASSATRDEDIRMEFNNVARLLTAQVEDATRQDIVNELISSRETMNDISDRLERIEQRA